MVSMTDILEWAQDHPKTSVNIRVNSIDPTVIDVRLSKVANCDIHTVSQRISEKDFEDGDCLDNVIFVLNILYGRLRMVIEKGEEYGIPV